MKTTHAITCGCCQGPASATVDDDGNIGWKCPKCPLSGLSVPDADVREKLLAWHKAAQPQAEQQPFRVEVCEAECAACRTPPTFHVIGPDGAAQGTIFADESEAEADANALNHAYELGRASRPLSLEEIVQRIEEAGLIPQSTLDECRKIRVAWAKLSNDIEADIQQAIKRVDEMDAARCAQAHAALLKLMKG